MTAYLIAGVIWAALSVAASVWRFVDDEASAGNIRWLPIIFGCWAAYLLIWG